MRECGRKDYLCFMFYPLFGNFKDFVGGIYSSFSFAKMFFASFVDRGLIRTYGMYEI